MTLPLSLLLLGALAALPLRAPKDTHSDKPMRVRRVSPAPPMPVGLPAEVLERIHARQAERQMREVQAKVRRDTMVFETPRESGDIMYLFYRGRAGRLSLWTNVAGGVKVSCPMNEREHITVYQTNLVNRKVSVATLEGRLQ